MNYLRTAKSRCLVTPSLGGRRIVAALSRSSDGEWSHNGKVIRFGIVPKMLDHHNAATASIVAGAYCLHLIWQVVS